MVAPHHTRQVSLSVRVYCDLRPRTTSITTTIFTGSPHFADPGKVPTRTDVGVRLLCRMSGLFNSLKDLFFLPQAASAATVSDPPNVTHGTPVATLMPSTGSNHRQPIPKSKHSTHLQNFLQRDSVTTDVSTTLDTPGSACALGPFCPSLYPPTSVSIAC